jgi:transglutaminase-like putative cysteine protease
VPLITVRHTTVYRYRQPVALGEHRIMFRPRDSYDQQLLEAKIEISPQPSDLRWVHDVFGNCVAIARFSRRTRELSFVSTISLNHSPTNVLEFTMEDHARTYPFSYDA